MPYYSFDNSASPVADNKPDFLIIAYRYNTSWSPQPVAGMAGWNGSGGGYSASSGLDAETYGNYTFDGCGFTACVPSSFSATFIHETGHSMFDAPHYGGANGIVGNYF